MSCEWRRSNTWRSRISRWDMRDLDPKTGKTKDSKVWPIDGKVFRWPSLEQQERLSILGIPKHLFLNKKTWNLRKNTHIFGGKPTRLRFSLGSPFAKAARGTLQLEELHPGEDQWSKQRSSQLRGGSEVGQVEWRVFMVLWKLIGLFM